MTCDHIVGAILLATDLSDTDRLVLFAIGCDRLSPDEILDRVYPFEAIEQLRSLIERSIVVLAEPDLLKINDPSDWADGPTLAATERIVEARRRAADPEGWDGPVLLRFSRGVLNQSPSQTTRKMRVGVVRTSAGRLTYSESTTPSVSRSLGSNMARDRKTPVIAGKGATDVGEMPVRQNEKA
jgi:hypothetical protein